MVARLLSCGSFCTDTTCPLKRLIVKCTCMPLGTLIIYMLLYRCAINSVLIRIMHNCMGGTHLHVL